MAILTSIYRDRGAPLERSAAKAKGQDPGKSCLQDYKRRHKAEIRRRACSRAVAGKSFVVI
ncbi:MAG: hypothetical protein IPI44_18900 [Sulfuritalea sp.]|nr:hypothetical protein [Sulfuritalea sp.]